MADNTMTLGYIGLGNMGTPMVVNMSLGENIGNTDYTALDMAVAHATEIGIVVVVLPGRAGSIYDDAKRGKGEHAGAE